jgi:hypothetical protein
MQAEERQQDTAMPQAHAVKLDDHSSNLDAALATDDEHSDSRASTDVELAEQAIPPTGVVLVDSTGVRNAEVQRLLRAPRYFDEDFEEAGMRCFKCGGQGHFARDCTAEAKQRSCFLCAQVSSWALGFWESSIRYFVALVCVVHTRQLIKFIAPAVWA